MDNSWEPKVSVLNTRIQWISDFKNGDGKSKSIILHAPGICGCLACGTFEDLERGICDSNICGFWIYNERTFDCLMFELAHATQTQLCGILITLSGEKQYCRISSDLPTVISTLSGKLTH